jgi:hypothetical protein
MSADHPIPRKNVLTDADIDRLRELLSEHPCKYPFTQEQAATLVDFADNVQTAKKISIKLFITAAVLTIFGWMGKGAVQWFIALVKTGGAAGK